MATLCPWLLQTMYSILNYIVLVYWIVFHSSSWLRTCQLEKNFKIHNYQHVNCFWFEKLLSKKSCCYSGELQQNLDFSFHWINIPFKITMMSTIYILRILIKCFHWLFRFVFCFFRIDEVYVPATAINTAHRLQTIGELTNTTRLDMKFSTLVGDLILAIPYRNLNYKK